MEENNVKNQDSFLIIDGNSIMNRAFYGIKLLSTKDGTYTNAIYGFLSIYYMMLEKLNPKYVAVAFDLSAPTFRHKMYAEYKAGRHSMPDELRMQMPIIKDVLKAMNIRIFEIEGFEADDVLGTISVNNTKNDIFTYILTGDKDSLQLVSSTTSVVMPSTKMGKTEYTIYTPEVLKEKLNIVPKQVIDLKALMGDKSDNIPGVPKIGEKTAYSLLAMHPSLEEIYENLENMDITESLKERLEQNKELAFFCKELATINTSVPLDLDYDLLRLGGVNLPELSKIFLRLSFKKFLERYATDSSNLSLETDATLKFYKNLPNTTFEYVTTTDKLTQILSSGSKLAFTYLDDNFSYNKLRNNLFFKIDNAIYIIKDSEERFKELLEVFCNSTNEKVGYNIKKLLKIAFDNNIDNLVNFNDDIMIAYYLLNATSNNNSIQNISYNLLDINFPELEEAKKNVQTNIFDMLETTVIEDTTLNENDNKYIFAYLETISSGNEILHLQLEEHNLLELYNNIEMPLTETLANIESNGMYVDKEKLKEFGKYADEKLQYYTSKIYELAKENFNINSTVQLGTILFDKLGLPVQKKNKTSYSTDKEVLEGLVDKHEIIQYILDYRTLAKLKSTYVDGLMEVIKADGRIHTTFTQTVTATGRLSSVEPNLQNIPVRTDIGKRIRECFVCQKPDYKIIDADYSQIELRVLADMSDDSSMINAYNSEVDIHTLTASQVFKVPLDQVTPELRSKAKAVNFGIVYGISDFGLAKNINSSKSEAKEYIESYFAHYTNVEKYMKELVDLATTNGYAITKFGRKRYVPELKSANHNTKLFGERVAMNMPIQGTAADIIKIAMNTLYRNLKQANLKAKLIMQVHDELIVEAPIDEVETVKQLMIKSMEQATKLKVPLVVDIHDGDSWIDAK